MEASAAAPVAGAPAAALPSRPGTVAAPASPFRRRRPGYRRRAAEQVALRQVAALGPQDVELHELGRLYRGTVVASTGGDLGLSLAGLEEVEAARAGRPLAVLRRREKIATDVPNGISRTAGLRVHLAMPVLDGGRVEAVVLLSRTPATVTGTVAGKAPEIAAVGLLLLLLVAGLVALASRLITRPLAAVVAAARQVATGGTARLPPVPGMAVREAAELSDAIARMTATLGGHATYVRGLAAHVSHEFKTPLAAMCGAAGLLGEHGEAMTVAERARFAVTIEAGVARLDRLVRGLLDLARTDMAAAGGRAALRPLAEAAAARALALRVEVSREAEAAISPDAAATVLDSLLGNALAHAGPGSAVTVSILRENGAAVMVVADDGPGLSSANAARAFDPFFTTARECGGTGLGLAIARSLVESAGGSIALLPSIRGAAFRIVLPVVEGGVGRDTAGQRWGLGRMPGSTATG